MPPDSRYRGEIDATVTGNGDIDLSEADGVSLDRVQASNGLVTIATGGNTSAGQVRGSGVNLNAGGNLVIRNDGQINGGTGSVAIFAAGDISQEPGRSGGAAVSGSRININAGGNVGLITLPLSVDAGGGAVAIDFTNSGAIAFVSGVFGSLNESGRVLGLGANTVLSGNVGSIQSSFEERVSFKLDSSQFATETRIFAVEGTGILPPEDQRE